MVSQRVAGPVAIGVGATAVYTVPAGRVFRGFGFVANSGAAVATVTVRVNGAVAYAVSIGFPNTLALNPTVVFNPGDVITATASAGAVTITLWGSLLVGAPV